MNQIFKTLALKIHHQLAHTVHEPPLTDAESSARYFGIEETVCAIVEVGNEFYGSRAFDPQLFYQLAMRGQPDDPSEEMPCSLDDEGGATC